MKKQVVLFLLCISWATVGIIGGAALSQHRALILASPGISSLQPEPTKESVGVPVVVSIPSLHVTANVETVAVDSEGRMDVPKNFNNVGWYSPGPKPGEPGNAVIDGHVNTPTAAPAVFANLSSLHSGDTILVTSDSGVTKTFTVTQAKDYTLEQLPLKQIFGPANDRSLVLITCSGVWDHNKKEYLSRFVVYARLKNG